MTRTALKMNGLSRIPLRSIRQGAKAPFKTKEQGRRLQIYYNHQKSLKKLLTSSIIQVERSKSGRPFQNLENRRSASRGDRSRTLKTEEVHTMKQYKFLVRVYFENGTKEQKMWIETTKDAKEKAENYKKDANVKSVTLYRIDQTFEF